MQENNAANRYSHLKQYRRALDAIELYLAQKVLQLTAI